jgi:AcrR family transcriptional regulator
MMNKPESRGRRPGRPETRAKVLDVARARFLADGYQAATMRSIAAEAGVDAALISYFFGSKRGLFAASMALTANPTDVLLKALAGDHATLPERLVRALVETWDDPAHGGRLRAMVGAAVADHESGRLLQEVIDREMIDRIAEHLGGANAPFRAAAVIVQLSGIVFARYVLALAPVATMSVDELVHYLAPGLRAVLRL